MKEKWVFRALMFWPSEDVLGEGFLNVISIHTC